MIIWVCVFFSCDKLVLLFKNGGIIIFVFFCNKMFLIVNFWFIIIRLFGLILFIILFFLKIFLLEIVFLYILDINDIVFEGVIFIRIL